MEIEESEPQHQHGTEDLLRSWNLPDSVIKKFTDNYIQIGQLKNLTSELLKELCPVIGLRLLLKAKIDEYVTAVSETVTNSSNAIDSIYEQDLDIDNISTSDLFVPKPHFPEFELRTLLTTSPWGKSILNFYDVHKILRDKHRNQLTDIIVRHIFTYIVNHNINYEDYNVITARIISLFPTENTGVYFVPPVKKRDSISGKPALAKGKLVDKVRNTLYKSGERKRHNTSKEKENEEPEKKKNVILGLKEKNVHKILWLKNNREPWDQVLQYWMDTYELRGVQTYKTVAEFLADWTILNDPRGAVLIHLDFDEKYPGRSSNFFLKWDTFFNKIVELKGGNITDENSLAVLEELKEINDIDEKVIKQIKLLCLMIPPKGRLNKRVKFSTLECQEGIIVNVKTPGDILPKVEQIASDARKAHQTVQPYILYCSESPTKDNYYLIIDKVKYNNFSSAMKALDTLFKCYHTLHATYPRASDHIYLIIQRCIYEIKTEYDNVVPYISDLLSL